ncbi:hypothetical protein Ae706Ps2_6081 [Pseudonocardia sp. Ae706_Ps2]|nr:hypothetical protein Ae706Ps2_6071 [Pseudonocardia sp. Ae706_Ps2]OLM09619.1 hypothetical protein Ae706Ps2_6081 [Pseudonocardia sp. Ae706_Ps2]
MGLLPVTRPARGAVPVEGCGRGFKALSFALCLMVRG